MPCQEPPARGLPSSAALEGITCGPGQGHPHFLHLPPRGLSPRPPPPQVGQLGFHPSAGPCAPGGTVSALLSTESSAFVSARSARLSHVSPAACCPRVLPPSLYPTRSPPDLGAMNWGLSTDRCPFESLPMVWLRGARGVQGTGSGRARGRRAFLPREALLCRGGARLVSSRSGMVSRQGCGCATPARSPGAPPAPLRPRPPGESVHVHSPPACKATAEGRPSGGHLGALDDGTGEPTATVVKHAGRTRAHLDEVPTEGLVRVLSSMGAGGAVGGGLGGLAALSRAGF